jgi:hypothetical protein
MWSAIELKNRRATRKTSGKIERTKPISATSTFFARSSSGISRVSAPETK